MAYYAQDYSNDVHPRDIRLVDNDRTACHCYECARLKQAARQLEDCNWWAADEAAKAVSRAQKAVWEARLTLHQAHSPFLYDAKTRAISLLQNPGLIGGRDDQGMVDLQEELGLEIIDDRDDDDEDVYSHESDVDASEDVYAYQAYTGYGGDPELGKFMVCDHCRAHALPCNEAPVCDQCQITRTACVHRWCDLSADAIDSCNRVACRYAHEDHLPVPEATGDILTKDEYIILPGRLRHYRVDGALPPHYWKTQPAYCENGSRVRSRQRQARYDFNQQVSRGLGSLDTIYQPCGDFCAKTYRYDLGDGYGW